MINLWFILFSTCFLTANGKLKKIIFILKAALQLFINIFLQKHSPLLILLILAGCIQEILLFQYHYVMENLLLGKLFNFFKLIISGYIQNDQQWNATKIF